MKAAFNKAVEWGYISENPFLKVRLPKEQKNQPKYLSEIELKGILSKIEFSDVKGISALSFYTGCRLREVVNLKWKNVNLNEKSLIVGDEDSQTKGRQQRIIPLCDEAVNIFQWRLGKVVELDGYVFHKNMVGFLVGIIFLRNSKRAVEKLVFQKKFIFTV